MLNKDPVSLWLVELRAADDSAADKIWNHFVQRLYRSAKRRLRADTRRVYDEEDAVQSAFRSFCTGIAEGRFPDLQDRDSLWQLLLVITARKVARRHRFDQQQCRDIRRNLPDLVFAKGNDDSGPNALEELTSREPTPEFAAEFVDVCDSLMQSLEDPKLHRVAVLRMEGYTDSEIAERLKCSRSTVQRRLEVVRRHWQVEERA